LAAGNGDDDALYQIAAGVEAVLNRARFAAPAAPSTVTPAVC